MKRTHILAGILLLLCITVAHADFTYTYDTDTPVGTNAPSVLDDHDRLTKDAIQEHMNVEHYWPLTGTEVAKSCSCFHRRVMFQAPLVGETLPTIAANQGALYLFDVDRRASCRERV